ncbi:hypothetical protein Bca52824_040101 [Brassica carinata]|uniref:Pyruvate kinase C-terminal domain-containing protein n=1 Tax=Brassica carinata TaxID=52824 RepID=A0A8X7UWH1_BRACI|nr:hypothetical protein Bca52824_040101 [Brassica carinata]
MGGGEVRRTEVSGATPSSTSVSFGQVSGLAMTEAKNNDGMTQIRVAPFDDDSDGLELDSYPMETSEGTCKRYGLGDESPARHSLIYRGLIPVLAEGSAKATDNESTEEIIESALKQATEKGLCNHGDAVVALHRIGAASVIKICVVK